MMKTNIILIIAAALLVAPAFAALETASLDNPSPDITVTNPATGEAWAHGDSYRLVFVTNAGMYPDSNDIGFYNDLVQAEANASVTYPNLGSVAWNVIGSTDDVDARDNTLTNHEIDDPDGPIYLVDPNTTLIAADNADLWDGEIDHIISHDPNGTLNDGNWPYTGTYTDGTKAPGHGASFSAFGGGGDVGNADQSSTTDWIWRAWTGSSSENQPYYGMSEPLYVVEPTLPWPFDAGPYMISWLDVPVQLTPTVEKTDESQTLTYQWSAPNLDPGLSVTFDSSATEEAPTVTISEVVGAEVSYPVTVEFELAVNYVGSTVDDATDSVFFDVYEDSCTAAQDVNDVTLEKSDLNEDCVTDIDDIAIFAQNWLQGDGLTSPQPK